MTLRQIKRAVQAGAWTLGAGAPVEGTSEFQQKRLTAAVTAARIYLTGASDTKQMSNTLMVRPERAAQIIRLGIKHLTATGGLRPADAAPPRQGPISLSDRGRG